MSSPNNAFYTDQYYNNQISFARQAARRIVPILINLFRPESVVDVGCGAGSWLREFQHEGVKEICGVDLYVSNSLLLISPTNYFQKDLRKPINLGRKFNLVLCTEV